MKPSPTTDEPAGKRWSVARDIGAVSLLFLGKGYFGSRSDIFGAHTGHAHRVAWAKQVHGAGVIDVATGRCGADHWGADHWGEGDALITHEPELPVSIATADCVPVLLHGGGQVAAVHAGWRGLVAGVIAATIDRLDRVDEISAWIGPAIGACCYEVSDEVARDVAATSSREIVRPGPADRPHIDLVEAARRQLTASGVRPIDHVPLCTRCETDSLWSYRREGPQAGRNLAYAWIRTAPV